MQDVILDALDEVSHSVFFVSSGNDRDWWPHSFLQAMPPLLERVVLWIVLRSYLLRFVARPFPSLIHYNTLSPFRTRSNATVRGPLFIDSSGIVSLRSRQYHLGFWHGYRRRRIG